MSGRSVLGISAGYHDAAAAVVVDGELRAAAQEERFSRRKHDPSMPLEAAQWCLDHAAVDQPDLVVFYDKPFTTYERLVSTHASVGPRGFPQLARAVRTWAQGKLWVQSAVDRLLADVGRRPTRLLYAEHHVSHAAAAFYPSPFERAAVLTVDGVGEWATTTTGVGVGGNLHLAQQLNFPDSVGLLYSTFTAYCGFAVNDGEYKLMGLAPYGEPRFLPLLREHVVEVAPDGAVRLDQRYFDYRAGHRMASPQLEALLGVPPRRASEALTQAHADLAASVQELTESIVLDMARDLHRRTGEQNLCLGGGVALNCVANARVLDEGPFDDVWVQPAAGDAGSAVGAALWAHHAVEGHDRVAQQPDGMSGAALGPAFDPAAVRQWLVGAGVEVVDFESDAERNDFAAQALDDGAVVGWCSGPMEFGPRALGHRSILADPRNPSMVQRINQKVKGREGFRPFAPAVLAEHADTWFEMDRPSPYMLRTVQVRSFEPQVVGGADFSTRLAGVRSPLPACTHVDGSARVQTVDQRTLPHFWGLIEAFRIRTGCPVVLNTSFNRADEPIVRTPSDALRCAVAAQLDLLVFDRCAVRGSTLQSLTTR